MSTPLTSTGPTAPEQSSPLRPLAQFRAWFTYITDWIKGLSPAGATVYDTGMITTGLTITPAANWAVTSYKCKRIGKAAEAEVVLTYSGATITADSVGNITDTTAAIMPAGWYPPVSRPCDVVREGVQQWFGRINGTGTLVISHGIPGLTLVSGQSITFRYMCFVA